MTWARVDANPVDCPARAHSGGLLQVGRTWLGEGQVKADVILLAIERLRDDSDLQYDEGAH